MTIAATAPALAGFNHRPAAEVERELLACCASPRWAGRVVAGRPYPDLPALLAAAEAAVAALPWSEVATALAAHPRIGERVGGEGREASWSRREQAGTAGADPATRAALVEANRAYEARFGHVFLICATGLTAAQMLTAARARSGHDPATEQRVVRGELGRIVRLRLERWLHEG